jgi:hypothetical protein
MKYPQQNDMNKMIHRNCDEQAHHTKLILKGETVNEKRYNFFFLRLRFDSMEGDVVKVSSNNNGPNL